MHTPTITYSELEHCDLLFYRPRTFFGKMIAIFEAIKDRKFDRMAFSHVALVLKDKNGSLKIFDALE